VLVVLSGGTGGAKLIEGLSREVPAADLFIVGNTGDDFLFHGLHVSPDLDTIAYTLAGIADPEKGWGIAGDTFVVLERLARYGAEDWFRIGDRDFATHIRRTELLGRGLTLSQVTAELARALGVEAAIVPMSDQRVETRLCTPAGELGFQEYFVKRRWQDEVESIVFAGAERSAPAPGVLAAIARAEAIVIGPSNPLTSIGPILAVPGIRTALREAASPVIAVSPIAGGAALSGPAHRLLESAGLEPSPLGVARAYADFVDTLLIDRQDASLEGPIAALGVEPHATDIRMPDLAAKRRLARLVLEVAGL
jgi:LPPG:FO 2-phospho-L-lactate transferase